MVTSVVCMKVCVDTNQLRSVPETGAPNLAGAPLRVSTFDENAVEEAVRIKERVGGKVLAVTVVPAMPPREILLKPLAMGVDALYVVRDPLLDDLEPLVTARVLAAAVRKLAPFDLVLCGESSIDQFNSQVGPRLAVELGLPAITYAVKVELEDGRVRAQRGLEDYVETVEAARPVVLTVGGEINQPRLPPVLQLMGASRKPVVEWGLADVGLAAEALAAERSLTKNVQVFAPPSERRRITIEGDTVEERVAKLTRALAEHGVTRS